MLLKSREDIEAPIAFVFSQVTDFTGFERQALRRGADVRRQDGNPRPGLGSEWDVVFKFRGKDRLLNAEIIDFDAPNSFVIAVLSGGITGDTIVDLVPLSRGRTRLTVATKLAANGLTAKLLLQSLKLARTNLLNRMSGRIAVLAREIEEKFARQV